MKKILITGSEGFIGSHLVEKLIKDKKNKLFLLVQYNSFSNIGWLKDLSLNNRVKIIYGDIRDWDTSAVTNMYQAFNNCTDFNYVISGWDTSSVTNMEGILNRLYTYITSNATSLSMGYAFDAQRA